MLPVPIHYVNNGPADSGLKLYKAAKCQIPVDGHVAIQLRSDQLRAEIKKTPRDDI